MVGFGGCGMRLRHALAHAADLRRICLINDLPADHAARTLNLRVGQTRGAVRLLRALPYLPSPERLALVVMRDWGMEDEDIAEMFDRSVSWAACVRASADRLRREQYIPEDMEYLDSGLQPGDPSPQELYARVAELRALGVIKGVMVGRRRVPASIPQYSWTNDYAFLSIGPG